MSNRARVLRFVLRLGLLVALLGLLGPAGAGASPGPTDRQPSQPSQAVAVEPDIPPAPLETITDNVGVMSSVAEAALERRIAAYEQQAGHQIIVWIDRTTGPLDLESFAARAFEAWEIGRAQLDDGVAMFVMVEDRAVRIEVGYGLEAVLTDVAAADVIRTRMLPAIRLGDWDAAVRGGVEGVVETIEGQIGALPPDPAVGPPPAEVSAPAWWPIAKIVGGVLLGLALLILLITHPRLAIMALLMLARGAGGGGGPGGFGGGGGRSGGGGATGRW